MHHSMSFIDSAFVALLAQQTPIMTLILKRAEGRGGVREAGVRVGKQARSKGEGGGEGVGQEGLTTGVVSDSTVG